MTNHIANSAPGSDFSDVNRDVSQKSGDLLQPAVSVEIEGARHVVTGNMLVQGTDWFSSGIQRRNKHALNVEQKTMMSGSDNAVIIKLGQSKKVTPNMTAVAWSPDGKMIATAGGALQVLIWDSHSLSVVQELNQGEKGGGSSHIAFSPDGHYLASGLSTVNVWETTTWGLHANVVAPHVIPGTPQAVGIEALAFSPDGKLLVVAYQGMKWVVIAYQVQDGKIAWSHEPARTIGGPLLTTPIVFTPDGESVIFGTGEQGWGPDGELKRLSRILFLDAKSGTLRKSIDSIHVDSPTALAISQDGKWIATGTSTGVTDQISNPKAHRVTTIENKDPIRVWEVKTGKLVMELPVPSRVWALAFSRDGNFLVSSRSDIRNHMTVAVWGVNSGKLVQEVKFWPVPLGLAVSPDGKQIAAAGSGQFTILEFVTNNK